MTMRRLPLHHVDTEQAENQSHTLLRTALRTVRKPLIAYSGGKESVVLAHLCQRYGLYEAVRDNALTFCRVEKQVRAMIAQTGLQVTHVDRLGRDWVFRNGNRKYLFPETKVQGQFYQLAQQTTVRKFANEHRYDSILFGRRTQENSVRSPMYSTADGMLHIMPISHWTVDQVWSYIRKHSLVVPDIYNTDVGIHDGCTTWNMISPEKIGEHPFEFIFRWDADLWLELIRIEPRISEYLLGEI